MTTAEFITDLSAESAPAMTDSHNEYPAYQWRSCSWGDVLTAWMKDGVVPKSMLESRIADENGKWLGEVRHDCLPDYSCCNTKLIADKFERENYVNGCYVVRSQMDRNYVLKMWMDKASKYGDDDYTQNAIRRFSTPDTYQRVM